MDLPLHDTPAFIPAQQFLVRRAPFQQDRHGEAGADDGQKLIPHSEDHTETHGADIHRQAAAVHSAQTLKSREITYNSRVAGKHIGRDLPIPACLRHAAL